MTDEEIIKKIRQGDVEAYSHIIEKYKNSVFGLIYKYTNDYTETQDIAQEVFIKVYKRLDNFKFQSKLSTWIYRIATNSCIDWDRKTKHYAFPIDQLVIMDNGIQPEAHMILEEQRAYVRSIVNSMPEKYKLLIAMYHFHNLKYKEISDILEIPEKTVETRLYRARGLIKKKLKNKFKDGEFLWNMKG